jgi:hypothetical protein
VIVFTPIISKTARCYHFTKKLEGESRRSIRSQPERSPLGLTVSPALLVRADEVIKKSSTVHESGSGTFETCQPALKLSAYRGRPEVTGGQSERRD